MKTIIKKKIKILALDPAEKFGWAISIELYGTWDFKLKRDESFGMKLLRFKAKLTEVIETEVVDVVVYERVSGIHANAIISQSKYIALIETLCTEMNIPHRAYSAPEIKKHATGKGNAKKDAMIEAAQIKFGYMGKDDNEADALWLLDLAKTDL